jgi:hypothetical protein
MLNEYCAWCGREPITGEHHLFRRSTSPEMIDDPNNKIELGANCHKYATEHKEVEQLFQEYFFLRPEKENLSTEYIAARMKSGEILSPRDVSRYRNYLAGEFSFLTEQFIELDHKKPFAVENYKKLEGVNSEARAERLYLMSDDGMMYNKIGARLKVIIKMLSALRTTLDLMIKESQNIF